MQYSKKYGGLPVDLGKVLLSPSEFVYVQYLPIWMREFYYLCHQIPPNLKWCWPVIELVNKELNIRPYKYMYLTVKHYYTNNTSCNRSGWHSDGFSTEDLNFIWYDCHPTQFCNQTFNLTDSHQKSIIEMNNQVNDSNIVEFPNNHLLMLDEKIIHRVNPNYFEGLRTFIKVSLSKHKYNLKGNSHNYLFDYDWEMFEREHNRNHPTKVIL